MPNSRQIHATSKMYCHNCGYDLQGQSPNTHRCPECGHEFDPKNPKTYRTRPLMSSACRRALRLGVTLLILTFAACVVLGGTWGWFYWGWKSEQTAKAKLGAFGISSRPLGGQNIRAYLGSAGWVLERTTAIETRGNLTDVDLDYVNDLKELEFLGMGVTEISDEGLAHLKNLKKLRCLDLQRTRVTDAGLARLEGLDELTDLNLSDTQITDTGLIHLMKLKNLWQLKLYKTKVTDAGAKALQEAKPNIKIYRRKDKN